MGDYTEIKIDMRLRQETPEDVRATLRYMTCTLDGPRSGYEREDFEHAHPLFATPRWSYMLTCGSAYHEAEPSREWLEAGNRLRSISNFKHYDGEIGLFASWIREWCVPQDGPIITQMSEYDDEHLTVLAGDLTFTPDPRAKR